MASVMEARVKSVVKRDGSSVNWDLSKIRSAVLKAMEETDEGSADDATFVARSIESDLRRVASFGRSESFAPNVESIQDAVEQHLMRHGFGKTAKAYILYREKRSRARARHYLVSDEARRLAAESKGYFPNALSEFIYYRTYSRWIEDKGRRETWVETVGRYVSFMRENLGERLTGDEYLECERAILRMEVMPSMRLIWSAGAAARATNVAAYNCAYIAPDCLHDFSEILYLSACGCGVGFSIESRNVQQLPVIARQRYGNGATHVVEDSKEGWADALAIGLEHWYDGADLDFDFREVRPAGARLITMGGRSSGPGPLDDLLKSARRLILNRQGRRLQNLDVHDLVCKTGEAIVSGGVRRAALISLSDLDDDAMRDAKKGHFFLAHGHRSLANNSAVYDAQPGAVEFLHEWLALSESGTGERGIFNRGNVIRQIPARRIDRWREMGLIDVETGAAALERAFLFPETGEVMSLNAQVGTNPCGEIYLLSKQFCNLTEVVCRKGDAVGDLIEKVRIATLLGTYQATLTNFPYLSDDWKQNCETERLLGVSLTGQWDCPIIMDKNHGGTLLYELRAAAISANEVYASRFGIIPASAITCGKPSGTVSQLVDSSSGGHPRFAPYYIRRVRISATDPLYKMLLDQGVPCEMENGQARETANTFIFSFACAAPEGSTCAAKVSAMDQLEHWLKMKCLFTEHNPSVTIYVNPDEWVDVSAWVWSNWGHVGGLSFLPRENHVYRQPPYEEITRERYDELKAVEKERGVVDYSLIGAYEKDDETTGSKELACVGGICEV